jgi:hypothetical protein
MRFHSPFFLLPNSKSGDQAARAGPLHGEIAKKKRPTKSMLLSSSFQLPCVVFPLVFPCGFAFHSNEQRKQAVLLFDELVTLVGSFLHFFQIAFVNSFLQ